MLNVVYFFIFARKHRVTTEMARSRQPLKALRDFLRHIAKFCFPPSQVREKRFYQKMVLNYCNTKLSRWQESTHHDRDLLVCHEKYWRNLQREDRSPRKLAQWCHVLISNREHNQSWRRWCVHLTACLIDRSYDLLPEEECHGVSLDDGIAFGPGHERILFDSFEKYMGSYELATYIFEHGVPRIFDYNDVFGTTSMQRTKMLVQTLDWWMEFIHNYVLYEHVHASFGKTKKLRSRPNGFRAARYKRTRTSPESWHNTWRQGQSGEWLWLEDGQTRAG